METISPASLALLIGLGATLLTGVQAVVTLGIMGWITSRKEKRDAERAIEAAKASAELKRIEKEEDYARQDLVAKRVADAAKEIKDVANKAADAAALLVQAQKDTIARTDEVARLASESDTRIAEQLHIVIEGNQKIHTLVNSDMTAARTSERDAVKLTLIALRKVQAMSEKLGLPVTQDELEAIATAEGRIMDLDQILADRLAAQHKVDADSNIAKAVRP
jgi:hypothetical protein